MSKEIIEISSDSSPSPSPARARAAERDVKNFAPLSMMPTAASLTLQTPLGIEARAAERIGGLTDVDDGNLFRSNDELITHMLELDEIEADQGYQGTNWFEEDPVQTYLSSLRFPGPEAGAPQELRWESMPSERVKTALSKTEKKPQKKKEGVTTAAAAAAAAAPDTEQKKKRAWTPCRWAFTIPGDPKSASLDEDEAYKRYKAAAKEANRAAKDIWSLERFTAECYGERFMKPQQGQTKRKRGQPPIYVQENLLRYDDYLRHYKATKQRKPKGITDQASLNAAHEAYWAGIDRPNRQAPVDAERSDESSEPEEPEQPEYILTETDINNLGNFERWKGDITRVSERVIEEWRQFLTALTVPEDEQPSDERIAAMFREYIKWKERNGL